MDLSPSDPGAVMGPDATIPAEGARPDAPRPARPGLSEGRHRAVHQLQRRRAAEGLSDWQVRIRVVGDVLPDWAEPVAESPPVSSFDLVIVRDATCLVDADDYMVEPVPCAVRIVVGAPGFEALLLDPGRPLPRADIAVTTALDTIDAVAACLVHLAATEGLICLDWADIASVARVSSLRAGQGTAAIVPGQGVEAGHAVRRLLVLLGARGHTGGVILCQFVSVADTPALRLADVDGMAEAALADRDGEACVACYFEASRTEVVVLAFRP